MPQERKPLERGAVSMGLVHGPEESGMGLHDFAMPLVPCRYGDSVALWVPYLYTNTDASVVCYRQCQGWPGVLADVELTEESGTDVVSFLTSTSRFTNVAFRAGTGTLSFSDPGGDPVDELVPGGITSALYGSLDELYPETIRLLDPLEP